MKPESKNSKNPFFSTYIQVKLNDWPAMRQCILNNTQSAPDNTARGPQITPAQWEEILHSPFGIFLRQKFAYYAMITRAQQQLILRDDLAYKESGLATPQKSEKEEEEELPAQPLVALTAPELSQRLSNLEKLTQAQLKQLTSTVQLWARSLVTMLGRLEIPLNSHEIETLQLVEPLQKISMQFREKRIELPNVRKAPPPPSFAYFLMLKCYLSIQSSLNRRHLLGSVEEILQPLRKLLPIFQDIYQEEQQLLATYLQQTQKLFPENTTS